MLLEWIVAVVLAYASTWAPRECEPEDTRCVAANEEKAEQLTELAQSILDESARQNLDPLMVTAIIARESSFIREPCGRRMTLDSVISWEPDGRSDDSYTLKWKCPNSVWGPECEKRVFDASEQGNYLHFSTCSANEVGFMQIVPWTPWARAGAVIPGTERTVVGTELSGEEGGRTVDLCGSPEEEFLVPDIDGTMVLQLTLPDDNDRDDRPETWSSIVTSTTTIDTGVQLRLVSTLPQDLEGFTNFTLAQGLPRASQERRELMLTTSVNIAVGCGELGLDQLEFSRPGHPGWWDWVGTYNAGSRGEIANRYAGLVLGTYVSMCETVLTTDEAGEPLTRLRDSWPACAEAAEAQEDR